MRHRNTAAVAAAALLVLTACGSAETAAPTVVTVTESAEAAPPPAEPTPEPSPTEAETAEPSAAPEPEAEPAADGVCGDASGMCTLGGTYEFVTDTGEPFGLSLAVSTPTEYSPSEFYFGGEDFENKVSFEVTITNTGETPFDPASFYSTLSSGGIEGEEVFDSDGGLDGSPTTPILPGASITFPIGYGLADPADITLQTSVDFEAAPVIWTP